MNKLLWTFQVLLALLFLFGGGTKLFMPVGEAAQALSLSVGFLRFIGVVEVLGGLGVLLPALTRIRPGLTPLAACGLVIVMIGATVITLMHSPPVMAIPPFVVGLIAAFVAYGRWRLAPLRAPTSADLHSG